jgi:hypothetical protein
MTSQIQEGKPRTWEKVKVKFFRCTVKAWRSLPIIFKHINIREFLTFLLVFNSYVQRVIVKKEQIITK